MVVKLDRVEKIKRKYGVKAFVRWGETGGNKYLNALGKGYKLIIVKPRKG